jgi:hypothetical protein
VPNVPPRLIGATLIGVVWLAGCVSPSPAVPSGSGPEPSTPVACAGADLRTPSGASVNLSGRWRAPSGGTFYVRQAGSCVWFVGLSDDTGMGGALATSNWVNSFFGSLSSDFTLHGSWADLLVAPGSGVGVLDFRLNFAEVGGGRDNPRGDRDERWIR